MKPLRWCWPILALVMMGCGMAGLFSRGSRSVIFFDSKGEVIRDKAGAPVVGTLSWDAKNVYPENLKTIQGATAGPEGAKTDKAEHWPVPEPKALSLILAAALAVGAGIMLYLGKPAFALPLVGAGIFVAAVPYVMPAMEPIAPYLAIGLAVAWTAILGFGYLRKAQGAAQAEAARDAVATDSIAKAIAEGDAAGAIRSTRDAWPEVEAKVSAAKAAGVKPAAARNSNLG